MIGNAEFVKERGIGMAQIVQPDAPNAGPFAYLLEGSVEVSRLNWRPSTSSEHQ
ncbi:MAG TPA: hypothetical protein VF466_03810 [Candidatus Saccharimonadales bacterium]